MASILDLPRGIKRALVVGVDLITCCLATWLAFYLRLGEFVSLEPTQPYAWGFVQATLFSVVFAIPTFYIFGIYKVIFRYRGFPALRSLFRVYIVYFGAYFVVFTVIGVSGVPRTVGIIQPLLVVILFAISRALPSLTVGKVHLSGARGERRSRAVIYGAGSAGRQLAAALNVGDDIEVVGFLDDEHRLVGSNMVGYPIWSPADLSRIAKAKNLDLVLLALPRISRSRRNEVIENIRLARLRIRTIPNFTRVALGVEKVNDLQELDVDDLLGRESVSPDQALLASKNFNRTVLVTGAGGSIGSELCRQVVQQKPKKLVLVEQSEFALYKISQEIEQSGQIESRDLIPILASVRDEARMREIFLTWRPDTVYHAAAHKHVPLVEHNPTEGIKNNTFGTLCIAEISIETRVKNFILISTDKAVRPTNIMGASKRLAELILQGLSQQNIETKLSMVRFGNVLGSSGSVVPKFRNQILKGGPVTVTHKDITRFFMTTPEAAQLVIQAGAMSRGGDVFFLDMGEPVQIYDLARRMIELSGLAVKDDANPQGDIEIQVTGLRPGEKLFEELLISEGGERTVHSKIIRAHEASLPWTYLKEKLKRLNGALDENNVSLVRTLMIELVHGYNPSADIVDWVFLEREKSPQS